MKIFDEFKTFALKGNVLDLAIAVIIGGAFGKVVTSLVNDVIMPPIGALVGGVNFSTLAFKIGEEATLNYGNFLQTVIDFLIVAWVIFLAIKLFNRLKRQEQEPESPKEEAPSKEVLLLTEIRDLLKR